MDEAGAKGMKVRISYTVDLTDDSRRKMRAYFGEDGLANRDDIRTWYIVFGNSLDDELSEDSDDE